MRSYRSVTLMLVLLCAGFVSLSSAQTGVGLTISPRGLYAIPVGSLADRLVPTGGAKLGIGARLDENWTWEGTFEATRFMKGNKDQLYFPDLQVTLELYGAGVQASYYPFGAEGILAGKVHPFMTGGLSVYRWLARRGAHATDSAGAVVVPGLVQQDWSLGFRGGAGIEFLPIERVGIFGQVTYGVIVGELWPALALRLENTSGFQTVEGSVGLRVYLPSKLF